MFVTAFPASGCPDRIACVAFHAYLLTQQFVFCFFKSCHFLDPLHTVIGCGNINVVVWGVAGVFSISAQARIILNRKTSITKPRILTPSQNVHPHSPQFRSLAANQFPKPPVRLHNGHDLSRIRSNKAIDPRVTPVFLLERACQFDHVVPACVCIRKLPQ